MSESDLDASFAIERMAREEQDDLDRKHGETIIAAVDAAKARQEGGEDPLLVVLRQAHEDQAKASEAEADQQ
jgi:hypothetical protein